LQLNEVCVLDSLEKFLWPTNVLSQSVLTLILTYPLQQSILKFICWLIGEKAYKAASEPYTVPIDKIKKILGITESIVSLSKHTFTPFHLGLAVQLHHELGSRGLVDNLNSHGFCASYSEVRRFLTSVVLKEEDSIKEGVYVSDGIVPVCQGGCPKWYNLTFDISYRHWKIFNIS
jgi:hypothetical protein